MRQWSPSLSWLWPGGLSLSAITTATLIAVFIYWGWDTAVSVNEETDDPAKTQAGACGCGVSDGDCAQIAGAFVYPGFGP